MPRLSLYRPEKSKDYDFIDSRIFEMFTVGGTDVLIHKYLGPKADAKSSEENVDNTAEQPIYDAVKETNIQDLLFLENRDRKYESDIYTIRGHYNVQDQDFDLRQFGLFLSNDTIFLTVHINSSVKTIGRKIMSGDVIELPHMKDEYAANEFSLALKRFYVVEDINRAAEGFSQTWYPHLYRLKCKQIMDSQEYKDILDLPAEEGSANTLRDLLSTYDLEMEINNAIVAKAEDDAALSGFETRHFFTLQTTEAGDIELITVDSTSILVDGILPVDSVMRPPLAEGYKGYLVGDGYPPNGAAFGSGNGFPTDSYDGNYFLRTDFLPNRLFRYNGSVWKKVEDKVRTTLTPNSTRNTQKGTFINNTNVNDIGGEQVTERQALSKALRPKADM